MPGYAAKSGGKRLTAVPGGRGAKTTGGRACSLVTWGVDVKHKPFLFFARAQNSGLIDPASVRFRKRCGRGRWKGRRKGCRCCHHACRRARRPFLLLPQARCKCGAGGRQGGRAGQGNRAGQGRAGEQSKVVGTGKRIDKFTLPS